VGAEGKREKGSHPKRKENRFERGKRGKGTSPDGWGKREGDLLRLLGKKEGILSSLVRSERKGKRCSGLRGGREEEGEAWSPLEEEKKGEHFRKKVFYFKGGPKKDAVIKEEKEKGEGGPVQPGTGGWRKKRRRMACEGRERGRANSAAGSLLSRLRRRKKGRRRPQLWDKKGRGKKNSPERDIA